MNIAYFFLGRVKISADFDNMTSLLNLCMYYKIPYSDFKIEGDRVTICFRAAGYRILEKEAQARGIEYKVEKKDGIPFIALKYKYRYGIMLGFILSLTLIILSQRFIWSIDVTGNERIG